MADSDKKGHEERKCANKNNKAEAEKVEGQWRQHLDKEAYDWVQGCAQEEELLKKNAVKVDNRMLEVGRERLSSGAMPLLLTKR